MTDADKPLYRIRLQWGWRDPQGYYVDQWQSDPIVVVAENHREARTLAGAVVEVPQGRIGIFRPLETMPHDKERTDA